MDKQYDANFFLQGISNIEFKGNAYKFEKMLESPEFQDFAKMIDCFVNQKVHEITDTGTPGQGSERLKTLEEFVALQQQIATASMIYDLPRIILDELKKQEEEMKDVEN